MLSDPRRPPSLRVLLIDDNLTDQLLAQEAFAELAPETIVDIASSGRDALNALRSPELPLPHVILLDVNMPGLNGFEVLRALKSDARTARIPVVMLTTSATDDDVQLAYALYASAYLTKAATFDGFLQQVRAFLRFWHLARPPH